MALPTQLVKVKDVWLLTMYFNSARLMRGWSERYHVDVAADLPGASPPLAATNPPDVSQLINFRLPLLGVGTEMVWARLSTTTGGNDAIALLYQPGEPIALSTEGMGIENANLSGDALLIRMETAARKHAVRTIKGLRDSEIAGNALTVDLSTWNPVGYVMPGTNVGLVPPNHYFAWFDTLLTKTFRAHFDGTYTIEPWTKLQPLRVGTRSLGAPFGAQPRFRRT
jgi:hypothetical protein